MAKRYRVRVIFSGGDHGSVWPHASCWEEAREIAERKAGVWQVATQEVPEDRERREESDGPIPAVIPCWNCGGFEDPCQCCIKSETLEQAAEHAPDERYQDNT